MPSTDLSTRANLGRAITLIEQTGSIQETMRRARSYADAALTAVRQPTTWSALTPSGTTLARTHIVAVPHCVWWRCERQRRWRRRCAR